MKHMNYLSRLFFTMLSMMLFMQPLKAGWFDDAKHFTAMQTQDGIVHFKILTGGITGSTFYSIKAAELSFTADGGKHYWPVVRFSRDGVREYCHNIGVQVAPSSFDDLLKEYPYGNSVGHIDVTNEKDKKATVPILKNTGLVDVVVPDMVNSEGTAWYIEFDYHIPPGLHASNDNISFKLHILEYKWTVKEEVAHGWGYYVDYGDKGTKQSEREYFLMRDTPARAANYEFQKADINNVTIAYDTEDKLAGPDKLAMFYSHNRNVHSIIDLNGKENLANSYAGILYIEATDRFREGVALDIYEDYNNDSHEYYKNQTNEFDIPAFHRIHDFKADLNPNKDGHYTSDVRISWKVRYPKDKDVVETDFFEIERATKPDFSDAESIAMEMMENDPPKVEDNAYEYVFIDASEATKRALSSGKAPSVYYRIRRASSAMWEWEDLGVKEYKEDITDGFGCTVAINYSVYQATLYQGDESDTYRNPVAKQAKDWEKSRKVIISGMTNPVNYVKDVGSFKTVFDSTAPILLYKTMIFGDGTTSEAVYEIPTDSLYISDFYETDYPNYGRLKFSFVDIADVPCVKYSYRLAIDTLSAALKGNPEWQYSFDVKNLEDFEFKDNVKIVNATASQGYFPDQVFLKWETEGGMFEDYTIYVPEGDTWKKIGTSKEPYFNDRAAVGGVLQTYKIVGQLSCGSVVKDSVQVTGFRGVYGSVSGRISYADDSGSPGIQVKAVPQKTVEVHKGSFNSDTRWLSSERNLPETSQYTVSVMMKSGVPYDQLYNTLNSSGWDGNLTFEAGIPVTFNIKDLSPDNFVTITETFDGDSIFVYKEGKLIRKEKAAFSSVGGKPFTLTSPRTNNTASAPILFDELSVFTRALTPEEVEQNYNRMLSGKEEGLVGYYHFDETAALGRGYFYDNRYMSPGDEPFDLKLSENNEKAYCSEYAQDDHLLLLSYTGLDGSYSLGGLSFLTGETYDIVPTSDKASFMFNNNPAQKSAQVAMSTDNAIVTGVNAINTSSVHFSATVYYDGSTIPVYHANFKVNGKLVKDAAGNAIESDASGKVKFNIPTGEVTIQAVMNGHKFLYDGYVVENNDSVLNIEKDLKAEFWDQTKVRLTGRIVGGDDEASKPLYKNLSINNLGDNLQFVLELEGDNVSHFVYDNVNHDKDIKTRDEVFDHTHGDKKAKHFTTMNSTLKRVTIHPDSITGEYEVEIFPTRYVVRQASAEGYATLFPSGVTSQTVDLSKCHDKDTAVYSLTYHSPISLTYQQALYGMPKDFIGEKTLKGSNIELKGYEAPLTITDNTGKTIGYTFGYPVFTSGKKYHLQVLAHEDYYYNNVKGSDKHTRVVIKDKELLVHNGLNKDDSQIVAKLNANTGYAFIDLEVNNPTFTMVGEDALRSVDMSVNVNGEFISCEPLRAFVTGQQTSGTDNKVVIRGNDQLVDILRDPQGAGSYAYIEKGSKYDFSYNLKLDATGGLDLNFITGGGVTTENGLNTPVSYTGFVIEGENSKTKSVPIQTGLDYTMRKNYSQTVTERITTPSGAVAKNVGANGDVYIGNSLNTTLQKVEYIGVMDSTDLKVYENLIKNGMLKIIAEPKDKNSPYYLTVSEKVQVGTEWGAQFAYTQYYIINTLLPKLVQERDSIILTGTADEIQTMADAQNKVLYRSLVPTDDENFGLAGSYHMVLPSNKHIFSEDKVAYYNNQVARWVGYIASNEQLKERFVSTKATPWKTYSVQNGVNITYSENTSYSFGYNLYLIPAFSANFGSLVKQGEFFTKEAEQIWKVVENASKVSKVEQKPAAMGNADIWSAHENDQNVVYLKAMNLVSKLKIKTILNVAFSQTPTSTETTTVNKGFTLSEGLDSYEDIAVYRITAEDKEQLYDREDYAAFNYSIDNMDPDDHKINDFVFLRKAGATRNPYLPAETTNFYKPGTVLSPASLKIDNPKITFTKHEISNVPADQAAVFEVILSNESEITDERKIKANGFSLFQEDATNTKGLKIFMDGQPITDGRTFYLAPGDVIKKTIEVYRGSAYDYDDVTLTLMSTDDIKTFGSAKFSVHYSHAGLPPTLTLPVDNWVMNTLSQKDKEGRYYIPVEIDNINPNENFDHVELQYKLQTQGDDMWVNLCSYYADSLLWEKASGNKQIFEGTKIYNVKFYGENDPIEQRYDIRAVNFYRHGSTYVTSASAIRAGLKDTRVPQLFGAVTPKNGILGVGDYISIPFSENIAANYLNEKSNFEITGYTNSQSLTGATSLQFAGTEGSMASTVVTRNLHEKDFTIDLMVQPETNSRKMVYFSQGTVSEYVEFGQDGSKHLYFKICAKGAESTVYSTEMTNTEGWSRVAAVYDYTTGAVRFYQGNLEKTETPTNPSVVIAGYEGVGKLNWGNSVVGKIPYEGRMFEARLWTKALTLAEITNTYNVHLSGFEKNLLAYYPMSEGVGNKAKDKANGATLDLNGQTWNLPRGLAMHVAPGDSLRLNGNKFNATEYNDFTLSFWFRADEAKADTMALLASGRGVANEVNANGRVFFGLANGNVVFQHNGAMAEAVGNYADQNWHQVALSVNRSHNIANLYVDDQLKDQLNASKIGSLSAGEIYLGYTEWMLLGDSSRMEPQAEKYPFSGYFDDIVMWNTALPEQYIRQYYNQAPNGEEKTLINHLSFSQRKQNGSGIYETVYNPYNNKVIYDDKGNVKKKTEDDRLVKLSDEFAKKLIVDQTAPIKEKDNLENVEFSFMGKDNELVINIDRLDKDINKQNIFITVADVEDMAGNPMASPLTWVVFVDRNQVRWTDDYVIRNVKLGESDGFRLNVTNTGATTMNYEITDLPDWLEVNKAMGSVGPSTDIPLEFTVRDILDAGEHSAIIYITDQNGLSDPLTVTVNVKADEPDWAISDKGANASAVIVAQVTISENNGAVKYLDVNTDDLVGAFIDGKCIGKAHITMENNNPMVYLSVRGKADNNIDFILWRANTGLVSILEGDTVKLKDNAWFGTPEKPIQLITGENKIQHFDVKAGWNWISFNIKPQSSDNGFKSSIVGDYKFSSGDTFKSGDMLAQYASTTGWSKAENFDYHKTYMLYVNKPGTISVIGKQLSDNELEIEINPSWNYLPYLCTETQSVTEAMTQYFDDGTPGDIIKTYNEFAMLTSDHRWVGSLTHMRPGVGYMIMKQKSGTTHFRYQIKPVAIPTVAVSEQNDIMPECSYNVASAMPVLATVVDENGECAKEGDVLKAFNEDVLVGTAMADSEGKFYLMTHAVDGQKLRFTLSGNGRMEEISTESNIRFNAAAAIGTYATPYIIKFNATEEEDADEIYDLEGRRVVNIVNGNVYIKNNKKIFK